GLMLLTDLSLAGANLVGVVVVLLASTLAFVGLGVMPAALPVMSPERGAEATHIFQGSLLLVSGVYYPVDVLPGWIRPISALSPATYTLSACRHLVGIGNPATTPQRLAGGPLSAVAFELSVLAMMGVVLIPLGLWVFGRVERWAKHTGRLKRPARGLDDAAFDLVDHAVGVDDLAGIHRRDDARDAHPTALTLDLDVGRHRAVRGEVLVLGERDPATADAVALRVRPPSGALGRRLDHRTGARVLQVAETELHGIGAPRGGELVDEGLERKHVRVSAERAEGGGTD